MNRFRDMIAHCEQEMNARHRMLRETQEHRKIPHQHEQWVRATKAFHAYHAPLHDLVEQCLNATDLHDPDLRAFAFDYVDYDPYFFRSGYILESLLQRIKKCALTDAEKTSLQRLLLNRIETCALRNFRHICRLIPMIERDGFHAEVCNRAKSTDPQIRRRAEFALAYFPTQTYYC